MVFSRWLPRSYTSHASTPAKTIPPAMMKNAWFWLGCQPTMSLVRFKISIPPPVHQRMPTLSQGLCGFAQTTTMTGHLSGKGPTTVRSRVACFVCALLNSTLVLRLIR